VKVEERKGGLANDHHRVWGGEKGKKKITKTEDYSHSMGGKTRHHQGGEEVVMLRYWSLNKGKEKRKETPGRML